MFNPSAGDNLLYPGTQTPEMNQHYILKQEHPTETLSDSYQPFMDSGIQPLSAYFNSHQPRGMDNSPEQFKPDLDAGTLLSYEFTEQYHGHPCHTLAATPLRLAPGNMDNLSNVDAEYVTTTESHMRYTAETTHNGIAPQHHDAQLSPDCVQTNEHSPSPPLYATVELDDAMVCDPRFVSGPGDNTRPSDVVTQMKTDEVYERRDSASSVSSAVAPASPYACDTSLGSDVEFQEQDDPEDDEYNDCGESEVEDDPCDDDDGEFVLRPSRRTRPKQRTQTKAAVTSGLDYSSHSSASSSPDVLDIQDEIMSVFVRRTRGSTAPVPVPNLTKKSRGRRVPTLSAIVAEGGIQKNARMYACKVKDCGKCFARGEHLKRHVRSIHTNEKRTFDCSLSATGFITTPSVQLISARSQAVVKTSAGTITWGNICEFTRPIQPLKTSLDHCDSSVNFVTAFTPWFQVIFSSLFLVDSGDMD
jgi:hypothetical protein